MDDKIGSIEIENLGGGINEWKDIDPFTSNLIQKNPHNYRYPYNYKKDLIYKIIIFILVLYACGVSTYNLMYKPNQCNCNINNGNNNMAELCGNGPTMTPTELPTIETAEPTLAPSINPTVSKSQASDLLVNLDDPNVGILVRETKVSDSNIPAFFGYVKSNNLEQIIDNSTRIESKSTFNYEANKNDACYNWILQQNDTSFYSPYLVKYQDQYKHAIYNIFNNIPQYSLSLFDLYSGQLFYDAYTDISGILFKGYTFPKSQDINNFYYSPCQNISNIDFNIDRYNERNILYTYNHSSNMSKLHILKDNSNNSIYTNLERNIIDNSISIDNFRLPYQSLNYSSLYYLIDMSFIWYDSYTLYVGST